MATANSWTARCSGWARGLAVGVGTVGQEAGVEGHAVGVHGGDDPQRDPLGQGERLRPQQDPQAALLVTVGLADDEHRPRSVAVADGDDRPSLRRGADLACLTHLLLERPVGGHAHVLEDGRVGLTGHGQAGVELDDGRRPLPATLTVVSRSAGDIEAEGVEDAGQAGGGRARDAVDLAG